MSKVFLSYSHNDQDFVEKLYRQLVKDGNVEEKHMNEMNGITHVTPANGNIFKDLALPEAENLKLRAELMVEIRKYVEESGSTQADAAKALKTTQPRLNDVIKGRIEKCTIDRLVNMLAEVGKKVEIAIVTNRAA